MVLEIGGVYGNKIKISSFVIEANFSSDIVQNASVVPCHWYGFYSSEE